MNGREGLVLHFEPACAEDFDALAEIRIAAMRESLERIGRFDPVRARDRLAASWDPALTRHIVRGAQRVGFFMVRRADHALLLQHLYLQHSAQRCGIGTAVMQHLIGESAWAGLPLRVTALRDSPANAFYLKLGFVRCASDEFDVHYVRPPGHAAGASAR